MAKLSKKAHAAAKIVPDRTKLFSIDEAITVVTLLGIALTAIGVSLVVRPARPN